MDCGIRIDSDATLAPVENTVHRMFVRELPRFQVAMEYSTLNGFSECDHGGPALA
jgi:hypothetical protein